VLDKIRKGEISTLCFVIRTVCDVRKVLERSGSQLFWNRIDRDLRAEILSR